MSYILIVEDNPSYSKLLKRSLSRAGTKSIIASNGYDAINQLDKKRPSAIILDFYLSPHNAPEILNEIRSYGDSIDIPVYIYSSHIDDVGLTRQQCENYSIKAIFDKSKVAPAELVDKMASLDTP